MRIAHDTESTVVDPVLASPAIHFIVRLWRVLSPAGRAETEEREERARERGRVIAAETLRTISGRGG